MVKAKVTELPPFISHFLNKFENTMKDEATKKRLTDLKSKQEHEKRLQKEMETRRQKNAKIKKYFADYQHGFKKSLKKKKVQGKFFAPFQIE